MNTQSEALYLADNADKTGAHRVAAELRRLHALNAELLEALKEINSMVYDQWTNGATAQRIANAAIARAEGTCKAEGEQA